MLISDSMPLLWLIYGLLSLIVLVTGYFGIRFLPLLPRLVITGVVAGAIWMPSRFTISLIEEGETYSGLAPAVVVAGIAFLQKDGGTFAAAFTLVALAMAVGAATGVALWWLWRRRNDEDTRNRDDRGTPKRSETSEQRRREPVMG